MWPSGVTHAPASPRGSENTTVFSSTQDTDYFTASWAVSTRGRAAVKGPTAQLCCTQATGIQLVSLLVSRLGSAALFADLILAAVLRNYLLNE